MWAINYDNDEDDNVDDDNDDDDDDNSDHDAKFSQALQSLAKFSQI